MICDRCKKREAKVYCTEILNGKKKEQHLCEECATEYTSFQLASTIINKETTLGSLLSTILSNYHSNTNDDTNQKQELISCERCGMSYEEFLQGGKFGCANCYSTLSKLIAKGLKNIQVAQNHTGKIPKGYITKTNRIVQGLSNIEKLSIKLQESIEKEEFEEAAKIRDLIKELRREDEINA